MPFKITISQGEKQKEITLSDETTGWIPALLGVAMAENFRDSQTHKTKEKYKKTVSEILALNSAINDYFER
jgi:hypothetical protein